MAHRIAGVSYWQVREEEWECLPLVEVLEVAGLWTVKEYILRDKATIAEYIMNHPIYGLCTGLEGMPGSRRYMWW